MSEEANKTTDTSGAGMVPPPHLQDSQAQARRAKFDIGAAVEHRRFGFRGVIFDVDPEFSNSEEWYQSIPSEMRPRKDQPFYHLFAVNPQDKSPYIAYVSEQNLVPLPEGEDVPHPSIPDYFDGKEDGRYMMPRGRMN